MKKEIRVIGIDDSHFDKFKDRECFVTGVFYRGGNYMDGVVSTKVKVDGADSTLKIATMLNGCKFKPQLQCILLDGIAVAGFNVIDIHELNKITKLPVIVVMRSYPCMNKIKTALEKLGMKEKIILIDDAGEIHKIGSVHVQFCGIKYDKVKEILKITCNHSNIPEPIRIAHLIGSGIVKGESKGNP